MSNNFRFKTKHITEVGNAVTLDEETLGYRPDGLYSHHVISFAELGGAKKVTKVEVMNPAGGLTEIAVDLKDNDVIVFTPYQISIVLATNARNVLLWAAHPQRPPLMGWRAAKIIITSDTADGATMVVSIRSEASANFGG